LETTTAAGAAMAPVTTISVEAFFETARQRDELKRDCENLQQRLDGSEQTTDYWASFCHDLRRKHSDLKGELAARIADYRDLNARYVAIRQRMDRLAQDSLAKAEAIASDPRMQEFHVGHGREKRPHNRKLGSAIGAAMSAGILFRDTLVEFPKRCARKLREFWLCAVAPEIRLRTGRWPSKVKPEDMTLDEYRAWREAGGTR
jgi:hypothetical protein